MKEKILMIDDEKEFLDTISERMKLRGVEVKTCTSTTSALEEISREDFDAIFLDLNMPGIDGIESLKLIKEKKPELQVILLTGYATLEKGVEAMKLGAMDFLEKPADINVLKEKVKKAHARKMLLVEKKTEERIKHLLTEKGW